MKKIILIIFLFFIIHGSQKSQTPDCMCYPSSFPPNINDYNRDSSIVFDTCGVQNYSANCDSAFWLNLYRVKDSRNRLYAKKIWAIWFDVKAFDIPAYDPDTLIELTWRDVDSLNYPAIKDSLEQIAKEFGNYKLVKVHPDIVEPKAGQKFYIYFENFVNALEIENKFTSIENTHCGFTGFPSNVIGIELEEMIKNNYINVSPNPILEKLRIYSENMGIFKIDIINITGYVVYSLRFNDLTYEVEIDLNFLTNGLYFLRINDSCYKLMKGHL